MRILVVEDEPALRSLLVQALREDGYAVDEAADGREGHRKALENPYDSIVLDVMLPFMDGWEVLVRLREQKATPVLFLTARDAVADRVRGLDHGADDYLVKPFALAELLARVRALVRRTNGRDSPKINLGEVVIDTNSRQVLRDGLALPLTAREYAIFELLASRRGELVTKSTIYDHIFDENDDSLSNLVEVHVSHLRKKVGKNLIQTRRGQGYRVPLEGEPATDTEGT
ncbi:MAG: response regulator transcription factor [Planctomycetota bacterium]|nr:response regulator transcription factor [Planctomycetota bacterium]RLS41126.1 MAG: DNA-binding response regulator [Planctomycetota bacterium]